MSASGRYLEDARGKPFLLHGDTAWSLMAQLSKEETEHYLENRRAKGFNTILVNLIEAYYADHPPKNKSGDQPFTTPGDFSTPNEAYFAHADWVLRQAGEKGLLVVLNPCYSGAGKDGFAAEIRANGPAKCREFGRYVGRRYKDFPNILWQAMGDQTPPSESDLERNWLEVLLGIKESDQSHLWSAHFARRSIALDQSGLAPHIDLNNAYGGNRSYIQTLRAYNHSSIKPTFYNEGFYESHPGAAGTPEMMRAQAYWALLSGATGHFFGSHRVWAFGAGIGQWIGNTRYDWREGVDHQGSRDMVHVKALFENRAWHTFVPDLDHAVVSSGYGTFGKDKEAGGDYVTAARTTDGKLVIAYVPSTGTQPRTITVDLATLAGPANARWYNPTDGKYRLIAGSPFANKNSHDFTTLGDNGTGTSDWVLVLSADSPPASATVAPDPVRTPARGPLRVHPTNRRYFTDGTQNADGSLRAVYLTGAHTWNNLVDIGPGQEPPRFDYEAYLDLLERHNHNFIRFWTMEEVAWETKSKSGSPVRNTMAPQPWARTGNSAAHDGKPKFDLSQFNPDYFARLRSRVEKAGQRGIYVAVMLFQGSMQQSGTKAWPDHPFHPDNNVNGIRGDADGDGSGRDIHTLVNPAVTRLQEAYVRRVIEAVGDLDNVLYEITNECGIHSTDWQYHMIRFIKEQEATRPKQHPVGMTFQYSGNSKLKGTNQLLWDSPADWISPNQLAGDWNYKTNPPPADGLKVVVPDTDHLGGIWGNVDWVWKCFTRGHNPILMDPYDESILSGSGSPIWEEMRRAMGVTRRLAQRVNLAAMTPQAELASTRYCLAEAGEAYLVYLPEGGEVNVDLSAASGPFRVEWIAPVEGTVTAGPPAAGGVKQSFTAPFQGAAVLLLSKANQPK